MYDGGLFVTYFVLLTLTLRHLEFDGQLKLALHRPGLVGKQRIGIKFRNYVTFYDLIMATK